MYKIFFIYYDKKSFSMKETYKLLSNLSDNFGNIYRRQIKVFDLDMREYFQYISKEFETFKQVLKIDKY